MTPPKARCSRRLASDLCKWSNRVGMFKAQCQLARKARKAACASRQADQALTMRETCCDTVKPMRSSCSRWAPPSSTPSLGPLLPFCDTYINNEEVASVAIHVAGVKPRLYKGKDCTWNLTCLIKRLACAQMHLFGVAGRLHLGSQNTSPWFGHPIGGQGGGGGSQTWQLAASERYQ